MSYPTHSRYSHPYTLTTPHDELPANQRQRLLPLIPQDEFTVLLEFEEIFSQFYQSMAQIDLSNVTEDSFEVEVASIAPDDLILIAIGILQGILFGDGEYSGISYGDICRTTRHHDIRATLHPDEFVLPLWTWQEPTQTETYHVTVLQDNIVAGIEGRFGQEILRRATTGSAAEAAMWRVLLALTLEIATAVSSVGRSLGIRETALMSYRFTGGDKYGSIPYAYVLYLKH